MVKTILYSILILLVLSLAFIYAKFNPADSFYFPRCPSLLFFGFQCAGCGSQRAVHQLLNLNFGKAWEYNPLIFILTPYILLLSTLELTPLKRKMVRFYHALTGKYAIISLLVLFLLYILWRNV